MQNLQYQDGGPAEIFAALRSNSRHWYRIASVVTLSLAAASNPDATNQGLDIDELSDQIYLSLPACIRDALSIKPSTVYRGLLALSETDKLFLVRRISPLRTLRPLTNL